jgi:predicted membrane-bound spermidine synthase
MIWLRIVFFASGFAALLYQVVWQRALFALFGIQVESVTVIVTAFLLGLGLGSLVGGAVSRTRLAPLIAFGAAELGIGAFGLVSLGLFRRVGEATLAWPPTAVALATFLLSLVPTLLMGATLPLLTAHLVRHDASVGQAVGSLYFVNTLGSAAAAATTAFFLLGALGQAGSVRLAAGLNVLVGAGALALAARPRS